MDFNFRDCHKDLVHFNLIECDLVDSKIIRFMQSRNISYTPDEWMRFIGKSQIYFITHFSSFKFNPRFSWSPVESTLWQYEISAKLCDLWLTELEICGYFKIVSFFFVLHIVLFIFVNLTAQNLLIAWGEIGPKTITESWE